MFFKFLLQAHVDLLSSVNEVTSSLLEELKADPVLHGNLKMRMHPSLFQRQEKVEKADPLNKRQTDEATGRLTVALAKMIQTRREAEFVATGPPKGVPDSHWQCCLGPCDSFRATQSMEYSLLEVSRYLTFGFIEDREYVRKRHEEVEIFFSRNRSVLVASAPKQHCPNKEADNQLLYTPLAMVPVRILDGKYKKRIRLFCEAFGPKLDGLFVCPSHFRFGVPQTPYQGFSGFTLHGLKTQMKFPDFNFEFVCPKNTVESGAPSYTLDCASYITDKVYEKPEMEPFDFDAIDRSIRSAFRNLSDKVAPFVRKGEKELPIFSTTKGGPPIKAVMKTKASLAGPLKRNNPTAAREEIRFRLNCLDANSFLVEEYFPGFFSKTPYVQFKIMNALHWAVEDARGGYVGEESSGISELSRLLYRPCGVLELEVLDFLGKMMTLSPKEGRLDKKMLGPILAAKSAKKKQKKRAAKQRKRERLNAENPSAGPSNCNHNTTAVGEEPDASEMMTRETSPSWPMVDEQQARSSRTIE